MAEGEDKPGTATPYLDMLRDAERCDQDYHTRCDRIDALYADLKKLAEVKTDRQYQLFWANVQVRRNAIYSRPPVPVVTSRFRDRKPLPRRAADILERALISDFEADDLHDTLVEARDDLELNARGVVWLRIVERDGVEVATAEHVARKDFRHGYGRKWKEVPWVARRAWLTKEQVKKRFGEIPEGMQFTKHRDSDKKEEAGEYSRKKAAVWELWHKDDATVVWVSEGVADVLDQKDPWIDVKGFFPCPRPAYGTLQRETLTPVPDVVYYRDQLEEINIATARLSALTEALKVRGFYAAGIGDAADAIETAFKSTDDRAVLVPVSAMAALGPNASLADAIVWLPLEVIANTITGLIALRRQLIEDVYEISGISDIMRGNTDANETLGAQQLKSQYGSIRIQDRQTEMVRLARDVTRMKAEIMAENVPIDDLMVMAQVDDLPTMAEAQAQVMQALGPQLEQAQAAMQDAAMAGDDDAGMQAQQAMQALQQQAQQQLAGVVTKEQVAELLQSQRVRPFVLEIETDSTIEPDEMTEKQKRVEFMSALGPLLQQGVGAMQLAPQLGKFMAESIRFVASGFRAGRQMDDAIDELAEQFANYQPPAQPGENPEAAQAEAQAKQAEAQAKVQVAQTKAQETQAKAQAAMAQAEADVQTARLDAEARMAELQQGQSESAANVKLLLAKVDEIYAKIGMGERELQLAETDQAIGAQQMATENERADKQHALAEKKTASDIKVSQAKATQPKGPTK